MKAAVRADGAEAVRRFIRSNNNNNNVGTIMSVVMVSEVFFEELIESFLQTRPLRLTSSSGNRLFSYIERGGKKKSPSIFYVRD